MSTDDNRDVRAAALMQAHERDRLAAMAMQGLLAAPHSDNYQFTPFAHAEPSLLASAAYAIADAMMVEGSKRLARDLETAP